MDEGDAAQARAWAERLGVDRSELLREALRRHLLHLASESDATTWLEQPLDEGERSLSLLADWGVAEGWTGWKDGTAADAASDVWFAATPGDDRPVLVLTRDPVAARIGSVVVAGSLSPARLAEACRLLAAATGC